MSGAVGAAVAVAVAVAVAGSCSSNSTPSWELPHAVGVDPPVQKTNKQTNKQKKKPHPNSGDYRKTIGHEEDLENSGGSVLDRGFGLAQTSTPNSQDLPLCRTSHLGCPGMDTPQCAVSRHARGPPWEPSSLRAPWTPGAGLDGPPSPCKGEKPAKALATIPLIPGRG